MKHNNLQPNIPRASVEYPENDPRASAEEPQKKASRDLGEGLAKALGMVTLKSLMNEVFKDNQKLKREWPGIKNLEKARAAKKAKRANNK